MEYETTLCVASVYAVDKYSYSVRKKLAHKTKKCYMINGAFTKKLPVEDIGKVLSHTVNDHTYISFYVYYENEADTDKYVRLCFDKIQSLLDKRLSRYTIMKNNFPPTEKLTGFVIEDDTKIIEPFTLTEDML